MVAEGRLCRRDGCACRRRRWKGDYSGAVTLKEVRAVLGFLDEVGCMKVRGPPRCVAPVQIPLLLQRSFSSFLHRACPACPQLAMRNKRCLSRQVGKGNALQWLESQKVGHCGVVSGAERLILRKLMRERHRKRRLVRDRAGGAP